MLQFFRYHARARLLVHLYKHPYNCVFFVRQWLVALVRVYFYMTKTTKVKTAVSVLMFSLWRSCYKRIWTDAITIKRSTALMLKNDDENCAAIVAVVPAEETRKIRDRGALAGLG